MCLFWTSLYINHCILVRPKLIDARPDRTIFARDVSQDQAAPASLRTRDLLGAAQRSWFFEFKNVAQVQL